MTYIELLNRFWKIQKKERLVGKEFNVYMYLLNEFNSSHWPAKLSCANWQICGSLRISVVTLCKCRRRLLEVGLIRLDEKASNTEAPAYILVHEMTDNLEKPNDAKPKASDAEIKAETEEPAIVSHNETSESVSTELTPGLTPELTPGLTPDLTPELTPGLTLDIVDKKENIQKKKYIDDGERAQTLENFFGKTASVESFCMANRTTEAVMRRLADEVFDDWELSEETDRSQKHLLNAIRIKLRKQHETHSQIAKDKFSRRRGVQPLPAAEAVYTHSL